MDNVYNKNYYDTSLGLPYDQVQHWEKFFGDIADRIVGDLNPKTVLDAGCAWGYLVAALRDRGVEAWGVDISEYAISKVRDDIRPYCVVGSVTEPLPEPLPRRFDLVVTIEMLEHLYEEDAETAIANLCSLSDTVLFNSGPDDITEPTHVNVRQPEYWAKLFARQSFLANLFYKPDYITPYAVLFKKGALSTRTIEDYEHSRRLLKYETQRQETINLDLKREYEAAITQRDQLRAALSAQEEKVIQIQQDKEKALALAQHEKEQAVIQIQQEKEQAIALAQQETEQAIALARQETEQAIAQAQQEKEQTIVQVQREKTEVARLQNILTRFDQQIQTQKEERIQLQDKLSELQTQKSAERAAMQAHIASLDNAVRELRNATCWKITWPVRKTLDIAKAGWRNCARTVAYCRRNGLQMTLSRIKQEFSAPLPAGVPVTPAQAATPAQQIDAYQSWIARYDTLTDEKKMQIRAEIASWDEKPLISILMPTYNTKVELLQEAIDSIRAQLYSNWELCIADDNSPSEELKAYLRTLADDPHIKVTFRTENGHICAASNSALELCEGVFTVLMDHDDVIAQNALYEVVKALRAYPDANVIYSDEDSFYTNGPRYNHHFKPKWDPYRILTQNYVSHLGAYRTAVLKEIGGFRVGYEGSQDHDLILRFALKSNDEQIIHIPKILYHWRNFHGSNSFSDKFLKQCEKVRRQCVRDYLSEKSITATVSEGFYGFNKIIFTLPRQLPKISCIIPAKNHADLTEQCIQGLFETNYPDLEVLLVDNGSNEKDAIEYCNYLRQEGKVHVITWEHPFNYSEINNMAAQKSTGDYLLFMNNDIKPIAADWINIMLGYAMQDNIGCVGAQLIYPDHTIQHAGIILGLGQDGVAGHAYHHSNDTYPGYIGLLQVPHAVSAVTGACCLVNRKKFFSVNGFTEVLPIAYNDVDFCLKLQHKGFINVYVPYAKLYHFESVSRGSDDENEEKRRIFTDAVQYMKTHWSKLLEDDPYYSPNLTRKFSNTDVIALDEEVHYSNDTMV